MDERRAVFSESSILPPVTNALKSFLKRNSFISAASEVRWKHQAGLSPIWLDFPVKPVSRYGYTRAPVKQIYELLDSRRESYKEVLASFLPFHDSFSRISVVSTSSPDEPFWVCGSFMGLEPLSTATFAHRRRASAKGLSSLVT
jgi:hypothetical protein